MEQLDLHKKTSKVFIKARSPAPSLPFRGQVPGQTTVYSPLGYEVFSITPKDLEKCGRLANVLPKEMFTCCPKRRNREHSLPIKHGKNYMCSSEARTIELLITIADLHDIVSYNYQSSFRFSHLISISKQQWCK